jgi:protease I
MSLKEKKVALFVADIYEDMEFWYPYYRLKEEGAEVVVLAAEKGSYQSKHGVKVQAEQGIDEVSADSFDALVIPGGYSPDHMRRNPKMVEFCKIMGESGKVVAAICHGGWMLASAGIIQGKKVTSFYSIRVDMENAGAQWVDEPLVKDENIITSRVPDDLPRFCRSIIDSLSA